MKTPVRFLLAALILAFAAPLAQAQNLGEIRARMEQRITKIDTLKSSGVLGENNRGFLEVRSGNDDGLAAAENTDRATVYAALAKQTGASSEAVGQARAKQIFSASAQGVWVQSPSGEWLKK